MKFQVQKEEVLVVNVETVGIRDPRTKTLFCPGPDPWIPGGDINLSITVILFIVSRE